MQNKDAFGKLERLRTPGGSQRWLPLRDHMVDVALCFQRLSRCQSIQRALEQAALRKLDEADIARLAVIVFLHDIGKANSGFQSKRWPQDQRPAPDFWPTPTGHGSEALALFTAPHETLAKHLPLEAMAGWGASVWELFVASVSHHGRPIAEDCTAVPVNVWRPVTNARGETIYDPAPVIADAAAEAQSLFPCAFGPVSQALPDSHAFVHLFAGLVQFADWLGSDTRHFPIRIDVDRSKPARGYADGAISALGLDTRVNRDRALSAPPAFEEAFDDHSPRPIQTAMDDDTLGPLVILESETGSGKTEAALWRFLQLFRRGAVDGLYFALPTRVAATQIYERVRRVIARLWPEDAPLVLRALPGYAAADGEQPFFLPDFKVQWSDDPNDSESMRRWAAEGPKRYLAAPVAVGTIDQALLGILKVKHAHMRTALLARSLLVVDEVHASAAYMTALLEKLLVAHLGNGGHALLLSATLGSVARTRYLSTSEQEISLPSFEAATDVPYPAISDRHGLRPMESTGRVKDLHWSLIDAIDNADVIAGLALDAAALGAKVLVIRNTVRSALSVFRALESHPTGNQYLFRVNGQTTLHHSRFSREDRPLLDSAVEAQLGKSRPNGPRIVIGTQTLEQSLDIDADLLITDICPMDVLLQRVGRLHRHNRSATQRPAAFRTATAIVLAPKENNLAPLLRQTAHGLGRFSRGGGIYPDLRIIEATRRLIQAHPVSHLPTDNRMLVEAATHPEQLTSIERELGDTWIHHGQQVMGESLASRTAANYQIIEMDKPFSATENLFPADQKVATRLGAEDRLVTFDPPPMGPFGEPVKQIPVRFHLLPADLPLEAQPNVKTTKEGVVQFGLGTATYQYSRIGLERIDK